MKKLVTVFPVSIIMMFVVTGIASAHVKVSPEQAVQGTYQTFTFSVPSEKQDVPTIKLRVEIPDTVEISRVEPVPGWKYELKRNDSGKITSVVWTATNGGLSATEFREFKMEGKIAEESGPLKFKAYQTYEDGSVAKWVGEEVPTVEVFGTAMENKKGRSQSAQPSNLSLYFSLAALVIAIGAAVLAMKKSKKD